MSLQQLQRRNPLNYVEGADYEYADSPNAQGVCQVVAGVKADGTVKTMQMSTTDELFVELLPVETRLDELNSNVGDVTDTPATTDTGNFSIIALIKRGLQHLTDILAGVNSLAVVSAGNTSVNTDASGSAWVAFPAQACERLVVVNTIGVAIEVRQGGAGVALPIPDGSGFTFEGITNASDLSLRRIDLDTKIETVFARWEQ